MSLLNARRQGSRRAWPKPGTKVGALAVALVLLGAAATVTLLGRDAAKAATSRIDDCLLGRWRSKGATPGDLQNTGLSGVTLVFADDGTETVDYSLSTPENAVENRNTFRGTASGPITAQNGTAELQSAGTSKVTQKVELTHTGGSYDHPVSFGPGFLGVPGQTTTYQCSASTLTYPVSNGLFTMTYLRVDGQTQPALTTTQKGDNGGKSRGPLVVGGLGVVALLTVGGGVVTTRGRRRRAAKDPKDKGTKGPKDKGPKDKAKPPKSQPKHDDPDPDVDPSQEPPSPPVVSVPRPYDPLVDDPGLPPPPPPKLKTPPPPVTPPPPPKDKKPTTARRFALLVGVGFRNPRIPEPNHDGDPENPKVSDDRVKEYGLIVASLGAIHWGISNWGFEDQEVDRHTVANKAATKAKIGQEFTLLVDRVKGLPDNCTSCYVKIHLMGHAAPGVPTKGDKKKVLADPPPGVHYGILTWDAHHPETDYKVQSDDVIVYDFEIAHYVKTISDLLTRRLVENGGSLDKNDTGVLVQIDACYGEDILKGLVGMPLVYPAWSAGKSSLQFSPVAVEHGPQISPYAQGFTRPFMNNPTGTTIDDAHKAAADNANELSPDPKTQGGGYAPTPRPMTPANVTANK
jgi:hypothetical protein